MTILTTDWPQTLEQFVLRPENSRAVPGNEQVSIRYGTQHAKHILLKSKSEIIENFKAEYPQCTYRVSTRYAGFHRMQLNQQHVTFNATHVRFTPIFVI